MILDWYGQCRWSTSQGEPLLYIKYCYNLLNILDVQKNALILKDPIQLETSNNGNLSIFLFATVITACDISYAFEK